jgi:TRAP-type C4-dicarboxylate transport system substrate-binding protein
MVSKKWWDGLSADEKKAIEASAAASRDFERKDSRAAALKAVDFLKAKGMQVSVVSDKELARMREKAKPAVDKFAADGGADVIKDLNAELAKVRK